MGFPSWATASPPEPPATALAFKGVISTTRLLLERKRLNHLQGRLKNHIMEELLEEYRLIDMIRSISWTISYPFQCSRSF